MAKEFYVPMRLISRIKLNFDICLAKILAIVGRGASWHVSHAAVHSVTVMCVCVCVCPLHRPELQELRRCQTKVREAERELQQCK